MVVSAMQTNNIILRIIPLILCSGVSNGLKILKANSGQSKYALPDDFMLGVSTAAYQIEGGWNADGKGESIWDTYLHKHPDFIIDHTNGDVAADSYHKYKEDIALIRDLGVKYYRMSISWPRILPQGTSNKINKEGVLYYRNYFEELLKYNITPIVTIYHWDLPTIFADMGGWTNPNTIYYFEDYAEVVFTLFGDIVKMWITVNEPNQHCTGAYGSDFQVPALNQPGVGEYLCGHYMLLAHARAYHLYDKKFRFHQNGKIGITLDLVWVEPKNATNKDDIDAAEIYNQMHLGKYAHPIFSRTGDYPELVRNKIDIKSEKEGYIRSRLPYFSPEEVRLLKGSSDFMGMNHYTTYVASPSEDNTEYYLFGDPDAGVKLEQDPNLTAPGVEWLSVYPPGLRNHINWVIKNYGNDIPIIIVENGLGDNGQLLDYDRVSYYNEYINQILIAIYEDGANVAGYFAWTLLDNFEWKYGYTVKFGLHHVNFNSPEKTRTPKLSAFNFKEIARTRKIDFDFAKKFIMKQIMKTLRGLATVDSRFSCGLQCY